MANIYDVSAGQRLPDIMGQYSQGVQTGQLRQQNQNTLAKQNIAMQDQQTLRGLAPQVISGDPSAYAQAAAIDPKAAEGYQSAGDSQLMRLKGAIDYMDKVKASGNPQAVEAAYQNQVVPYLRSFGLGGVGGHSFAQDEPGMEKARAMIAATMGQQKPDYINVPAQGAVFDKTTGKTVYTNPGAGPKPQLIQTANGSYVWATPGAGATPLTYGSAQGATQASSHPPSDPMAPFIAQANDAIKMGAPEEQVKAWLMQKAAAMGGQPITPADQSPEAQNQAMQAPVMGQQGIQPGAPVMGPQKATAEDKETFGAPQMVIGTDGKQHLVQFGNRGGQKEVSGYAKPEMTPVQAAKQAVQQEKANASKADAVSSYDQSINQIDSLLNSPGASMLGTYMGDVAGLIPHTDTSNAVAALDNIKNQVLLNTISKLKALSATGASGFGSLSNQEGEILKNSIASLDKKQSNDQLLSNLRQIKTMLQESRDRVAGKEVTFDNGSDQQTQSNAGQVKRYNPATGMIE